MTTKTQKTIVESILDVAPDGAGIEVQKAIRSGVERVSARKPEFASKMRDLSKTADLSTNQNMTEALGISFRQVASIMADGRFNEGELLFMMAQAGHTAAKNGKASEIKISPTVKKAMDAVADKYDDQITKQLGMSKESLARGLALFETVLTRNPANAAELRKTLDVLDKKTEKSTDVSRDLGAAIADLVVEKMQHAATQVRPLKPN